MERDHLEVLLENIQGRFDLVLEGHESLRKEICEARDESNQKHDHTAFLINVLNKKIDDVEAKLSRKIDAVASDLAEHRADTEGHRKAYRVSDTGE